MYAVTQRLLDAVSGSHRALTTCEVWSPTSAGALGTFHAIAGNVTIDRTRAARRLAQCSVVDPTGVLVPLSAAALFQVYGNEVRLNRGVLYSDGTSELVPLGVFGINTVEISEDQGGVVIALDCVDRSARITRARWTDPYSIAAGTNLATAVDAIISNRFPAVRTSLAPTTYTLPATVLGANASDQAASDPWRDCVGLMADAGYDLYFDASGVAVSVQTPDLAATNAVLTYDTGDVSVVLSAKRTISNENVTNGVIVTAEGSSLPAPIRAESWDMNPQSPTYRLGNYGDAPQFYTSPLIQSQQQAQDTADAMLAKAVGRNESLEWTEIVNPALDVWDVIKILSPNIGVSRYAVIDALTIPLDASTPMSASTRITLDIPVAAVVSTASATAPTTPAFTLVGSTASTGTTTTIAFTIDPAAVPGDIAWFTLHEQGASQATYTANRSIGIPTFSDWELGVNVASWVYTVRLGDAGQVVTVTSSLSQPKSGEMMVFHNVSGGSTEALIDNLATASSLSVAAAGFTTAHDSDLIATFHAISGTTSRTWSLPAGMTAGPTTDTGAAAGGSASATFYILNAGPTNTVFAGPTSTPTGTANKWGTVTLGLKVGAGVVVGQSTTTSLSVPGSPASAGSTETMTATVSPSSAPGTVNFFDGLVMVGSATLISGSAAITAVLASGVHSLTAVYSPANQLFVTSTSSAVAYTVNGTATATATVLTVSPVGTAASGATETLTATVSSGSAVGTVQFADGTTPIGAPVTVSNPSGVATKATILSDGSRTLNATFTPTNPATWQASTATSVSYFVSTGSRAPFVRGSSFPAGRSATFSRLGSKHWRFFDNPSAGGGQGFATTWAGTDGGGLNSTDQWCYSIKPDMTVVGGFPSGSTNATYTALINKIITTLSGAPDTADNCWFCIHHEPENDTGFTIPQYVQAQINACNDILPVVNAGRTHKIRYMPILQGVTFDTGNPATYLTPGVLAVADGFGADVYKSSQVTNAHNQILLAQAFSASHGNMPWGIPEHGYYTGVNANQNDANIKAGMIADINTISAMSTANQPVFDDWYDQSGNDLQASPSRDQSAATWKAAT